MSLRHPPFLEREGSTAASLAFAVILFLSGIPQQAAPAAEAPRVRERTGGVVAHEVYPGPLLRFPALPALRGGISAPDAPLRVSTSRGDSVLIIADDVDFGIVYNDQFPRDRIITLRNAGVLPVTVSSAAFGTGSPFRVQSGLPVTLQPGGSASVIVRFLDPVLQGTYTDTLRYMCSPTAPEAHTVASGRKVFRLSIEGPASVSMYIGPCDPGPRDSTVVLHNPGTANLLVTGITLSNDSNFTLTPALSMPRMIPAGDSIAVPLRFQPKSPGDKFTTIRVASAAQNSPLLLIPVNGRKESAELVVLSLYFGNLTPNLFPDTGFVAVKNNGTLPIVIDSAVFGAAPPFRVLGNFPALLQPSDTWQLPVEFADPGTDGYYSDTLAFSHAPSCGAVKILVAGTRISAPKISGPSSIRGADMFCSFAARDTSIRISNTGAFTLNISAVTIAGGSEFSVPSLMPRSIEAGKSDTLTLRFFPATPGYKSSTLTIHSNAVNEPRFQITVFAMADTPRVAMRELHFGRLAGFPAVRDVVVRNLSVVPVTLDSLMFLPAGRFTASAAFPLLIAPGDSAVVQVIFEEPPADGVYSAYMIAMHRPRCEAVPVLVDGERYARPLLETPAAIDFPAIYCAGMAVDSVLHIKNTGGSELFVAGITMSGDAAFTIQTPSLPARVQPEQELLVPLRFAPIATGAFSARVDISSNAANGAARSIALRGRKDSLLLSAARVDFGTLQPTQIPSLLRADARNSGSVSARIVSARFARGAAYTLVTAIPLDIAVSSSAGLDIRFAPAADGSYDDTLIVEYEPSCTVLRIPVSGTQNTRPEIAGPGSVDFPVLLCEGEERDTTITLRNTGGIDLFIASAVLAGDADFSLRPPFQPFAIARGGSATIGVHFSPAAVGDRAALLTLTNTAGDTTTLQIPLRGRREHIALSAEAVDFGTQVRGALPLWRTVVVRNNGTVPMRLASQNDIPPFFIETPLPLVIMPGDSATLSVRFSGKVNDGAYSERRVIATEPRCDTLQILISGEVVTPAAVLEIGNTRAAPGEIVEIPVYLRNARHLATAGVTGFRLHLRFNRTLLQPLFNAPSDLSAADRVIRIDLPATAGSDDLLAMLRFEAALGNDSITTLTSDSLVPLNGPASVTVVPGLFTLNRICREGGVRLLNPDGVIALRQNNPNPFNPRTEIIYEVIEAAHTRLYVADHAGRLVATLVDAIMAPGKYSISFDASSLPSGVYFSVLETATQALTRTMLLVK